MQRAIDVQPHYVVDHPKGETVIQKICLFITLLETKDI